MPDMESVITHLQIIHTWAEFARERDLQFFTAKHMENIAAWTDDAIALIKEQDKEISRIKNEYLSLVKVASKKPEIIQCKDCKHWDVYDDDHSVGYCDELKLNKRDWWFCADGQRKTACDGCENKGGEDCALGEPGSDNAYCPNGKLR